eukprot:TRINITY_DN4176_c0_g1_i1.p1 TRINITY_DN4176_c0_g1~~TRINITY_DN4176_c0_g1_i1.p1  ORF type:complete len:141 (+),score=20.49 TRINITY_DN4176_c0_g1_i1:237-659(+)
MSVHGPANTKLPNARSGGAPKEEEVAFPTKTGYSMLGGINVDPKKLCMDVMQALEMSAKATGHPPSDLFQGHLCTKQEGGNQTACNYFVRNFRDEVVSKLDSGWKAERICDSLKYQSKPAAEASPGNQVFPRQQSEKDRR